MSDRETVDFLAGVPLLEGREEADIVELARVMRRRTVQEGELLWRQGDDAREMVFVVDGVLSASLQLPGNRSVVIGSAGPGEAVGEIALLDGGGTTMSVRATETTTVLALGRMDFAALLAPLDPPAFTLRRRLASLLSSRHRSQLRHLALSLGGDVDRPAGRGCSRGRSPSSSTAARLTAPTSNAWRPSTTSTRWRSGAS